MTNGKPEIINKFSDPYVSSDNSETNHRVIEIKSNTKLWLSNDSFELIKNNEFLLKGFRLHAKKDSGGYYIWFFHKDDLNEYYDKVGLFMYE